MAGPSPFDIVRAARDTTEFSDGTPLPPHLHHMLMVLATYYPHIFPSHDTLAEKCRIKRRQVSYQLAALEAGGLISRDQRSGRSTYYRLHVSG